MVNVPLQKVCKVAFLAERATWHGASQVQLLSFRCSGYAVNAVSNFV
jgi:hypothetical protein